MDRFLEWTTRNWGINQIKEELSMSKVSPADIIRPTICGKSHFHDRGAAGGSIKLQWNRWQTTHGSPEKQTKN